MSTPINPEAFDLACKELFLTITAHKSAADVLGFDWKSLKASTRKPWETATRKVLTAYLEAVAQPVVNTREELDALPVGSAITTFANDRCTIVAMKVTGTQWASTGQSRVWTVEDVHTGLAGQTATVLHRPEES